MSDQDFQVQMLKGMAELKSDMGELKKDVGQLKVDVSELKVDVGGLKVDVVILKREVTGLYAHTEELAHQYGTSRQSYHHLYGWVQSHEEDIQLLKKKVAAGL